MKLVKNLSIILFFILFYFLIFEALSRTVIFLITKNKVIFEYGFNKTILFKIKDLSKLDFIIISEKKEKAENNQKLLNSSKEKLTIWAFGGSTTEGHEPRCGQDTSSWVEELSKLNENILTVNFGKAGNNTSFAVNALHKQAVKKEFKHTVGFNVSIEKLKHFYLYDFNTGKPDIILWAGKHNEQSNYTHVNKSFNKKNYIKFIQRLDYTFKINSLFYFLLNDTFERVSYKILGSKSDINQTRKPNENTSDTKNLELSKQIYKNNTIKAIEFAKYFDIDFHIISLFGRYGYGMLRENYGSTSDSFYHVKFYDYWFETAEKISKQQNVYFFKTEEVALATIRANNKKKSTNRKVFFCDAVHQTLEGNILTASIINDYLMKIYNYENN